MRTRVDAAFCSNCRGGQSNLVSSTMLASLLFSALPSLWIHIRQRCMFLPCWGVCQAALPTPQTVARGKTPGSSTMKLSAPRQAHH